MYTDKWKRTQDHPILPKESKALKDRVQPGDRLRCPKPKRYDDPEIPNVKNPRPVVGRVVKKYPFIVFMNWNGKETSMTWAEAVILNRKAEEK